MIFGMSLAAFTVLHVIISLIAIVSGVVVVIAMLRARRVPGWTALFLVMTILTSATGFMFPIHGFTPALGVGSISLVVLLLAVIALYALKLRGAWRWIYVVTAVVALWFNIFVLIVQSFQKIPFLHALAPTQSNEPAFIAAQGGAFVILLALCAFALFRFRPVAP